MGKKKRRTSKGAAVYVLAGVLIIVLLTLYGVSVFLRIVEIEVTGETMYTRDEVVDASGIKPGDNMLFFDADSASRNIRSELPYISEVNITRIPPTMIHIEIAESKALAVIRVQDENLMIDSNGRVLQLTSDMPGGLIDIRGFTPSEVILGLQLRASQGDDFRLQCLIDALTAIEREGIQKDVSYLEVTNLSNITIGYSGRFRVILGDPYNLRQKLTSLPVAIAGVDAREPSGVTGTLRSEANGEWRWTPDR